MVPCEENTECQRCEFCQDHNKVVEAALRTERDVWNAVALIRENDDKNQRRYEALDAVLSDHSRILNELCATLAAIRKVLLNGHG